MNITNIFKQYVLQRKNTAVQGWKRLTLVLIITSSVLVALTVYMIVSTAYSTRTDTREMAAYTELVANPELGIARRYAEDVNLRSENLFLASNPELSWHRRFAEGATLASEYLFMASNPEIGWHRRFAEGAALASEYLFLASNPEISWHRHFIESQAK
jgi:hypothetical protein